MRVYLVAAGKGGCGKSTTSAMLAKQLSEDFDVGVLDLDTSGPNLPKMLGITDLSPNADLDNFYPKVGDCGVQVMSPAFLIPPDMACAWSGDKRMELIKELIAKTKWSNCDVLLCDCPPGTGDEIIAVLESLDVDGVVLVATAKEESIDDAKRTISLFGSEKFAVPIICAVESMSYMRVDGEYTPLFTDGVGIEAMLGLPCVFKVPYDINLSPVDYEDIAAVVIDDMGKGEVND